MFAFGITLLFLLRKIPLPEVTRQPWIIAKLSEQSERERMIRISQGLPSYGIEGIVKEALAMDPSRRISPEQIIDRSERLRE